MALPRIVLRGRKIILLSGYRAPDDAPKSNSDRGLVVQAEDKLLQSAWRHPDAVAFGYVGGRWIAAA